MRGRDAEVGADPVAFVGLHHAVVLLDGAAHHRHALADERLHLVRRQPLAEPRRADDVGEQNGDRAELVFACRLVHGTKYQERRCGCHVGARHLALVECPLLEGLAPFTLRNIKKDLEDIGSRFDGAPDLEFRAATKALELEKSGLSYQRVPPGYRFPYGTRT